MKAVSGVPEERKAARDKGVSGLRGPWVALFLLLVSGAFVLLAGALMFGPRCFAACNAPGVTNINISINSGGVSNLCGTNCISLTLEVVPSVPGTISWTNCGDLTLTDPGGTTPNNSMCGIGVSGSGCVEVTFTPSPGAGVCTAKLDVVTEECCCTNCVIGDKSSWGPGIPLTGPACGDGSTWSTSVTDKCSNVVSLTCNGHRVHLSVNTQDVGFCPYNCSFWWARYYLSSDGCRVIAAEFEVGERWNPGAPPCSALPPGDRVTCCDCGGDGKYNSKYSFWRCDTGQKTECLSSASPPTYWGLPVDRVVTNCVDCDY